MSAPTLIGRVGVGGLARDADARGNTELEEALRDLRGGRMVATCSRGGTEAQLTIAAEHCGADAVNAMAREACGLICLALPLERCEALGLEPMRDGGTPDERRKRFTVSIEARTGVTTGISAADRARTIAVAIDPDSGPEDIVVPGHVFPTIAESGGDPMDWGGAERAVELVRAAGLTPAAVTCDILDEEGAVMERPKLDKFCRDLGIRLLSGSQISRLRP